MRTQADWRTEAFSISHQQQKEEKLSDLARRVSISMDEEISPVPLLKHDFVPEE
jgi:hypothetical protein